ncbi:hypothetical protein [Streptomyces sp. NPDC090022]|uniref:hypothetical protein n=1 Tax=Streptomyces sp. NPDC090022 TaxID=3365920 RepID=UPI003806F890
MARTEFPEDLLDLQIRVIRIYAALDRLPAGAGATRLRRELVEVLRALYGHPYWRQPGHCSAELVELRRQARIRGWIAAA